jgi:hypothetical protein
MSARTDRLAAYGFAVVGLGFLLLAAAVAASD